MTTEPARGFYRGAPDLAIEVLSPDDRLSDVRRKVEDYLSARTPMVVIVDPDLRALTVHRAGVASEVLEETGTLDLGPIVSGFSVSVGALFE